MDRLANYIFTFILIFLFILEGGSDDHGRILIALLLSLITGLLAFLINWISLDALFAVSVAGTVILGLGGWILGILIVLFFVSSSLLSRRPEHGGGPGRGLTNHPAGRTVRRSGLQIWANGFWTILMAVLWFLFRSDELLVLGAASIAAVTADTWATELGSRKPGRTVLITDFRNVKPGTDGGVSLKGTLAGISGSILIALCFLILSREWSVSWLSIVAVSGFFGFVADSFFGAIYLQYRKIEGHWCFRFFNNSEEANHAINWLCAGIGVIVALILIQLF